MTEVCQGCGTEFMVGARFCHLCGTGRGARRSSARWARYLEFHQIREGLGLSTGSLVAFFLGLGCVLAAVAVWIIYSVQTINDLWAVQLYRMQWLVAAVAAFVAGMLLKKSPQPKD
jgi:ribosomal protein L37E